eukprot:gene1395-1476_t
MSGFTGFDPRLCETFTAPTNIAVIKYWGKDNLKLNTPMNSSASLTLDQSDLHTITTVAVSKDFTHDQLWLNGKEIEINGRGKTVIQEIRKIAQDKFDATTGELIVKKEDWSLYHVRISSVNTFPTGAGLASSAAGLACLVATLAKVFAVKEEFPGQLTAIARQGSGSASRSLYGGFVKWIKGGEVENANDSIAVQIADENFWPELRAVILVVSDKEKDTSSTAGMETSRKTSLLLQHRAAHIVEGRLAEIEKAFLNKDFETFGRITMQDSNQFHAVCMDTYPPIFYMNDVSKSIIKLVHVFNEFYGEVRAAYTFDAGPNAVIYTLDKYVDSLLAMATLYFPTNDASAVSYCNRPEEYLRVANSAPTLLPTELQARLATTGRIPKPDDVKFVFLTKVGPGPINVPISESLLDPNTGEPVAPGPNHKRMKIGGV